MRRILTGAIVFLALLGTVLVLPVYAAPAPEAEPVEVEAEQVTLGSLEAPAQAAEVQEGTTEPVAGVSDTAPALTVSRTGVEFSMVNVNWLFDPAVTDTVVQVRVQDPAGQWGEWTEVETEDAEPEAGGEAASAEARRGATAPLWTGPSTGVEVELVTRSGAAPTDVQLDLIDPGTSAADTSLGTPDIQDTADAAMAMPDVYSRAQWGADERLRTWGSEYASTIKAATVHHTASSNNYTAADVPAILRGIYYSHAVSNGWGDIGYNVLVDKFGRLWEGRSGGLASTVIGAHAGGFNTSTFGVSMLGNYDVADTTQPMVDAVSAIIAWKFSLYGVDPRGSTTLTSGGGGTSRYAAGVRVTVPTIFGHRDVGSTACPGRYGYSRMDEFRAQAARQISGALSGIETYYRSNAATRASLGTAVGAERPVGDGGWYQEYQYGAVYWSPPTGAHAVFGGIRHRWSVAGGTGGFLGYPAGEMRCGLPSDGCAQDFAGGSIYWSPSTDSRLVFGGIRDAWLVVGGPSSPVGYPTAEMTCALPGGGCRQSFQYGDFYWSGDTGARFTSGAVLGFWNARGGPQGLGYPVTDLVCGLPGGGCGQDFQRASVYWSPVGGAQQVEGGVRAGWLNAGGPGGPLGYPVAGLVCGLAGDGCRQAYERGWVYWSAATGAQATRGEVQDAWTTRGGHAGPLGYPATPVACGTTDQGCWQQFQGGILAWQTTSGAHSLPDQIGRYWLTTGAVAGPLGAPDADAACAEGGASCTQPFRGGTVGWSSSTGVYAVRDGILPVWVAAGAEGGALGFPTGDTACGLAAGGCTQTFQGGLLAWSPATGAWATGGAVGGFWGALQGPAGVLGYPTAAMTCGLPGDGCRQEFQGGPVVWSPATGSQFVSGAIARFWAQSGGPGGGLGYPVSGMTCGLAADGCRQQFQGGPVYWSQASGAVSVSGAIQGLWNAYGAERSGLGYPLSQLTCGLVGGGCRQLFQGGLLVWSPAGGTHVLGGAIDAAWAESGRQNGVLGYPTAPMVCGLAGGGCGQQFQGGSLHWSPAAGVWSTHGAIRQTWADQGWERGSLGYPSGAMTCTAGGDCQQRFQGGTLRWVAALGRVQRGA